MRGTRNQSGRFGSPQPRGFTLLELIVALAIFAMMAAMAYGGLQSVLDTRQRTDEQAQRLNALLTTMTFLERDLEQAASRSIRDEFGDTQPPMMGDSNSASTRLELTRFGWSNPLKRERSTLQRVGYRLENGVLVRESWYALDRPPESKPVRADLLDHVSALRFRFMDKTGTWQESWPPTTNQGSLATFLPRAVEVTLTLDDWGEIRRLFPLTAGG